VSDLLPSDPPPLDGVDVRGETVRGDTVLELVEIRDGDTTWRFERAFLESNWTCIWRRGCQGILAVPAPELGQGCCSVGAELDAGDEARRIAAMAAFLDPARFEHHEEAAGGIFRDERRDATRVVDGACIFLNRPGFSGGAGCALHLAALDAGESPIDWKPSVCWQLPIRVDWSPGAVAGEEVATVRRWRRTDWGDDGEPMAWCCTEEPEAYVGDRPVVDSLADELDALVGPAVRVELRRRLSRPAPPPV
jgi:hypothetical protein